MPTTLHNPTGFSAVHYGIQTTCCVAACRIYYSFDKLLLGLLGLKIVLPLFIKGGGWTDCVVVQQDVRVMVNSRRDTLVLQRMR